MGAKKGDTVKVEYEGRLDDGTVFDSNVDREPLEFELGANQVIKGFDNALVDMEVGQEKSFSLEPKQAYGDHNPALIKDVPKGNLPDQVQAGTIVMAEMEDGTQVPVTILKIAQDMLTIDVNHPLAGKNLNFTVKLLAVGN